MNRKRILLCVNLISDQIANKKINITTDTLSSEFRYQSLSKPSLPKAKMHLFGGKPFYWAGFFTARVHNANITKSEITFYLKSHLSGKAKQMLTRLSFDGSQYEHAWKLLSRHYGQPHIIADAPINLLQNFAVVKMHDSYQTSSFAGIVSIFVSILSNFGYQGDLKVTANINMILAKLPPDLIEK